MLETLSRIDTEAQERLNETQAETALSTANVASYWLLERELRLDAAYYSESAMQARQVIEGWHLGTKPLAKLTSSVAYPTRFKRIHTRSRTNGVPFLTPSAMLHFRPHSETYLAKRPNQLEKCTVQKDWILATRSGTVGRCVIIGERLAQFAITDDAIRIKPSEAPIGYLYAFLMSWVGQALLTKDQYGSAIKHLESHHVANIPVPVLPEHEMNQISESIQKAYALREEANALLDEASEDLYQELELPPFDEDLVEYLPTPKTSITSVSDAEALRSFTVQASTFKDRFDASYHLPVFKSVVSILKKSKYQLKTLGTMANALKIPPRFKRIYVSPENGVPFLLPSHLAQITAYNLSHISTRTPALDALRLNIGDVLISTDGTIGRVAIATKHVDGWAGSNNIARITYGNHNNQNGYLAAFLMSPYGQHQLKREIYGGVVDHIDISQIEEVLIPDAPKITQRRIGRLVVEAFENKEQANVIETDAINALERILQGD